MNTIKKIIVSGFLLLVTPPLPAKEFLNTIMHINFGATYGFIYGDIIDEEKNSYYITEHSGGKDRDVRPAHYDSTFSIFVDFTPLPPLILGDEAHALKFGVRGAFKFQFINQTITIAEGSTDKSYGGDFIITRTWMAGPVIHYAPFINASGLSDNYTAGGGFTLFFLYGRILNGKLYGYPAKRDYEGAASVSNYQANITGYRLDMGMGGEISICSINLGLNLYYSIMEINLSPAIYPNLGDRSKLTEFCFEIYMGIPIEWDDLSKIF